MKINEMEALAGISKKNIRFYEEQGLISPRRNKENGYREYSAEDVDILHKIKLLRKLGVPIEEIRRLQRGECTVNDAMRRHIITLEREEKNIRQAVALCAQIKESEAGMDELDAEGIIRRMDEMEKQGTSFHNKQRQDVKVRYVAPVVITVLMVALMLGVVLLMLWAYKSSPEDAPPMAFLAVIILICVGAAAGVVLALCQRISEILKGEIDDASKY